MQSEQNEAETVESGTFFGRKFEGQEQLKRENVRIQVYRSDTFCRWQGVVQSLEPGVPRFQFDAESKDYVCLLEALESQVLWAGCEAVNAVTEACCPRGVDGRGRYGANARIALNPLWFSWKSSFEGVESSKALHAGELQFHRKKSGKFVLGVGDAQVALDWFVVGSNRVSWVAILRMKSRNRRYESVRYVSTTPGQALLGLDRKTKGLVNDLLVAAQCAKEEVERALQEYG